jgi:hypothetical protein
LDFKIKIILSTERSVIGKPISQLVELLMGTVINTPEIVNRLNPNSDGTTNLLFTADIPANKPNANVTIARIPKDKK